MTTTKKLSLILLIAAIAVVLVYAVSLSKNQVQPEDNRPVENATTTNEVNNATSSEPVVATSTVENIDTKDWKTYKNTEYGYTLIYPKNWAVKDVNYYDKDLGVGIKYTSFTDHNYYLIFLLNKVGENFNYGRTGISAGDFIKAGELKVSGINITINNLVYEGKTREIFFSGRNEFYNIAGHFSYLGDNYDANFNFDVNKFKIAEKIIKSLKLFKPIMATTNTKDWLTYRNEEYGFEVKYPKDYLIKKIKGGISLKHPTYDLVPISPAKGGAVSISLTNKKIEDYVKAIENTDPPLSRVISQKEYILDGVEGVEIISTYAEGLDYYDIFIKYNNKDYLISYGDIGYNYTKEIISTFKFVK